MITVYAIRPTDPKVFQQTCNAFSCNFKKINDIREINIDKEIIVFHQKIGENFEDFVHPKEVCYIFGADEGDLDSEIRNNPNIGKIRYVKIKANKTIPLHASVACGIVLHDRFMKTLKK